MLFLALVLLGICVIGLGYLHGIWQFITDGNIFKLLFPKGAIWGSLLIGAAMCLFVLRAYLEIDHEQVYQEVDVQSKVTSADLSVKP